MGNQHSRFILGLTLAVGVVVGGALAGCRGQQKSSTFDLPPASQNLGEAQRLAVEGQRAQKAGDNQRAKQLYQESLANSRELHPVWNNLGLLMMEEGNYMDAVEMFRTAADLAPYDPQPYFNIAVAYDHAGWSQDAMRYYERALERDGRHVPALRGFARSAKLLDIAEPGVLARVRTALLVDRDQEWREFYEREQYRMERAIREQRSAGRPRGGGGGAETEMVPR
jgi:tetratricopeptide (TPR) repeat protein